MAVGNPQSLDKLGNQGGLLFRIRVSSSSKVRHYQPPFRPATFNPKRDSGAYSVRSCIASPLKGTGKGHYSRLILVRKPNGKFRTIINKFITYRRFKMETVNSVVKLIPRGAVMATIDLKEVYYLIPIHQTSQKYLRFAVPLPLGVLHLQFICLPFGICSAPCIFTKIMTEVVKTPVHTSHPILG